MCHTLVQSLFIHMSLRGRHWFNASSWCSNSRGRFNCAVWWQYLLGHCGIGGILLNGLVIESLLVVSRVLRPTQAEYRRMNDTRASWHFVAVCHPLYIHRWYMDYKRWVPQLMLYEIILPVSCLPATRDSGLGVIGRDTCRSDKRDWAFPAA